MNADLILASGRTPRSHEQEMTARLSPMQTPGVLAAINAALDLLPALSQARAARARIMSRIEVEAGQRRRFATLSPAWAALVSIAGAAIAMMLGCKSGLNNFDEGQFGTIVLISDAAALAAFAIVAVRHALDRSRQALRRILWCGSGLTAAGGLLVLGADAFVSGGGSRFTVVAAATVAGALPWLFVSLKTEQDRRLSAELHNASTALAAAEMEIGAALVVARTAFEAEIAPIVAAVAGVRPAHFADRAICPPRPQLAIASSEDEDDDDVSWSGADDCGRIGIGPRAHAEDLSPKKPARWGRIGASARRARVDWE